MDQGQLAANLKGIRQLLSHLHGEVTALETSYSQVLQVLQSPETQNLVTNQDQIERNLVETSVRSALSRRAPSSGGEDGVDIPGLQAAAPAQQERHVAKVGRNDPCPCGSGKKYKKCHGENE